MTDPLLSNTPKSFQDWFNGSILPYSFSIMVLLVIVLIYLIWTRRSESFMPTATMMAQNQETVNVGGSVGGLTPQLNYVIGGLQSEVGALSGAEHMAGGVPAVTAVTDPASALMPGSPSWVVLNNPSFACNSRDLEASADYRAYQVANMGKAEGMTSGVSSGFSEEQARLAMQGQ